MDATYRRTKLLPPYKADGKSTMFPARNVPGVYLIYREDRGFTRTTHELLYVGYSASDVYKAMYRHFQAWNDRQAALGQREERVTFTVKPSIKVRVVYCRTGRQAAELEQALIIKHRPRHNPDKLAFYELTAHGQELVSVPGNAEFITDETAPF